MDQQSTDDSGERTARNRARRRLIRTLVAGGGIATGTRLLPGAWSRPVVDAVALPAHAQTTPGGKEQPDPFGRFQSEILATAVDRPFAEDVAAADDLGEELLAFFAPVAEAVDGCGLSNCTVTTQLFMHARPGSGATTICDEFGVIETTVDEGPQPTCGGGCLQSAQVFGGVFDDPDWILDIAPCEGGRTEVRLSPGGPGCDGPFAKLGT